MKKSLTVGLVCLFLSGCTQQPEKFKATNLGHGYFLILNTQTGEGWTNRACLNSSELNKDSKKPLPPGFDLTIIGAMSEIGVPVGCLDKLAATSENEGMPWDYKSSE